MRYRDVRADRGGPAAIVLRGVLSVPEFRAVLQRERNRSERSHLPFSVLICTVRGEGAEAASSNGNGHARVEERQPARSQRDVGRRRRRPEAAPAHDRRGRLARPRPARRAAAYTPIEEAHAVLAALERELHRAGVSAPWSIESYPPAGFGRVPSTNGSTRQDSEPDDSHGTPPPHSGAGGAGVDKEVPLLPTILFSPLPAWKRVMDVAGATFALMLLWPVILAAAIAIKLDTRGPVFYRQRRIGAGGREFGFFKLRTMQVGADEMKCDLKEENEASGPVFKMRAEPRITRVGRFLRRSSIDELPQFLERPPGGHVAGGAPPADPRRGRPLRALAAAPAADHAGHHLPLAGERPQRGRLRRLGPPRPALRRAALAGLRPRAHRQDGPGT
jgi:hypothetical protein